MPATVNSTVGSCGMRLAEGTTWWPRSAKKPVKAVRSSSAVRGVVMAAVSLPRLYIR
ncbi:unannotated protein [freshwater metagenome]|uniref:Unannotated protein n=1 Tax=freshwater metagenome TaxID=449393 RepID=A0A6J6EH11_9ZZZZ